MMKKYLMMGASALVMGAMFTACSNDEGVTAEEYYQALYNQAFEKAFGKVSPNQDWGFGPSGSTRATRSGNTSGGDYTPWPYTHGYKDANGNLIASANMNHNQWGSTDLQSMPYGGWIVPDPLTVGQKLRVQKYFQANPNLSYQDPYYANFYVQQVYTGGTSAPETGNKELTHSADGQGHKGMTLNQLTVGQAASHINDFNAGTCSASSVLDEEGNVYNDQITLMLNVDDTSCFGFHETSGSNVNSNEDSNVYNHNDKMALVSAAVIDAWAEANGIGGDPVVDKWNRSFMGFDYELLPEADIVTDSYALLSQVPNINNIHYAWDGNNVMVIGEAPAASGNEDLDITSQLANATKQNGTPLSADANGVWTWDGNNFDVTLNIDITGYTKLVVEYAEATPNNYNFSISVEDGYANYDQNRKSGETKVEYDITNANKLTGLHFMNGNGTFKIKKIYLTAGSSELYYNSTYLLGDNDTDKIAFYSTNTNMYGGTIYNLTEDEMKTTQDGKTCLNLVKFQQLKKDGYHPISTDLKTWVKWQAACDGYYSDWIVTLTEAKRIDTQTPDSNYRGIRIMAEDLSASEASDFDFNDVVFDVEWTFAEGATSTNKVKVTLWAAGGTLPLMINSVNGNGGFEVHNALGVSEIKTMINTHAKDRAGTYKEKDANGVVQEVTYYWLDDAKNGKPYIEEELELANGASISKDDFETDVNKYVRVEVEKNGKWYLLTAERGTPACKFGCPVGTPWAMERHNMNNAFTSFKSWVNNSSPTDWYNSKVTEQVYNAGKSVICAHGQH